MTIHKTPWGEGLDADEQRVFLGWALAVEFKLPSPFALHDSNPNFEVAAFNFWASVEDEAMTHWIEQNPGSRPQPFWWWRSGDEPLRRRLGGSGAAEWTDHTGRKTVNDGRHNFKPFAAAGITKRTEEMKRVTDRLPRYQGTWRGLPVMGWDGGIGRQTINPADPPIFESEATCLDRRGLLLPEERERLSDADFSPVALIIGYSHNGGIVSVETEPMQ